MLFNLSANTKFSATLCGCAGMPGWATCCYLTGLLLLSLLSLNNSFNYQGLILIPLIIVGKFSFASIRHLFVIVFLFLKNVPSSPLSYRCCAVVPRIRLGCLTKPGIVLPIAGTSSEQVSQDAPNSYLLLRTKKSAVAVGGRLYLIVGRYSFQSSIFRFLILINSFVLLVTRVRLRATA